MPIQRSFSAMQASATRLIKGWGGPAVLHHKDGTKRNCIAAIGAYNPQERALVVEDATRILIVAPLAKVPDFKNETIEFPKGSTNRWRIQKPVSGLAPDGKTWIKYDCECLDGD